MTTTTFESGQPKPIPPRRWPQRWPWTDRAGRLSWLKLAVFLAVLVPGTLLLSAYALDALGPKPATAAIHDTGDWAVRFLLASLAVTPLRRLTGWGRLILVRRMLGVATMAYALLHLLFYVVQERYDLLRVASEIVLRFYLLIGFAALAGLVALGATSFDRAVQRLGPRWHRLHSLVYAIAALAIFHFFLQAKSNVGEATVMAGLFVLLMGYRLAHRLGSGLGVLACLGIALAAGAATAAIEFAWYGLATGVNPWRVLSANLALDVAIRPSVWVAIVGLGAALLPLLRSRPARAARSA